MQGPPSEEAVVASQASPTDVHFDPAAATSAPPARATPSGGGGDGASAATRACMASRASCSRRAFSSASWASWRALASAARTRLATHGPRTGAVSGSEVAAHGRPMASAIGEELGET